MQGKDVALRGGLQAKHDQPMLDGGDGQPSTYLDCISMDRSSSTEAAIER
ncbi:unnamed protein product [Acidithrix sp. C25]|nr:unnamed protein product [Acidithrix sp. C25]